MRRRGQARSFIRELLREWREDRIPDLAAQVAFFAILSLFPAMLAFTAALSVLDDVVGADLARRAEQNVIDFLTRILTEDASSTIDAVAELFAEERPGLLTLSLVAALWGLTRCFAAVVRALDVVYDLDEHRGWLPTRLTAIFLALGSVVAGTVMVTVIVVGPLLGTGQDLADQLGMGSAFGLMWDVLRLPAAFGLLVLYAATIFHVAPDHSTPWRADLPGAAVTAVLWVSFSAGLRIYLATAAAGNAVYGTLGGVLVVLIWFWLLALAVMMGGQVNATLWQSRQDSAVVQGRPEAGNELADVDGAATVEEDTHDGRADGDTVGGG